MRSPPLRYDYDGEMTQFYQPPLDGREEDPFVRDGDDKLIRRSYWLDLSDRSIVLIMTRHRHAADRRREARPSHRYSTAAPDRHHPGSRNPAAGPAALTRSAARSECSNYARIAPLWDELFPAEQASMAAQN